VFVYTAALQCVNCLFLCLLVYQRNSCRTFVISQYNMAGVLGIGQARVVLMGVGRGQGVLAPPWIWKTFIKTGCFISFEW